MPVEIPAPASPPAGAERSEPVMGVAWWCCLGAVVLAFAAVMLRLPGAALIAPWLFWLGVAGLAVMAAIRIVRRLAGSAR